MLSFSASPAQIVNSASISVTDNNGTHPSPWLGLPGLDNGAFPYPGDHDSPEFETNDPHVTEVNFSNFNATMFLMWTSSKAGSIPIAVRSISWIWSGDATFNSTTHTGHMVTCSPAGDGLQKIASTNREAFCHGLKNPFNNGNCQAIRSFKLKLLNSFVITSAIALFVTGVVYPVRSDAAAGQMDTAPASAKSVASPYSLTLSLYEPENPAMWPTLVATITNTSTHTVTYISRHMAPKNFDITVDYRDPAKKPFQWRRAAQAPTAPTSAPSSPYIERHGSAPDLVTLKPGGIYTEIIDLSNFKNVFQPGDYRITASIRLPNLSGKNFDRDDKIYNFRNDMSSDEQRAMMTKAALGFEDARVLVSSNVLVVHRSNNGNQSVIVAKGV